MIIQYANLATSSEQVVIELGPIIDWFGIQGAITPPPPGVGGGGVIQLGYFGGAQVIQMGR